MSGRRGGGWYLDAETGEVFERDRIHGRWTLLAHIDELAETYGLYQRLEPSSS